MVASGGLSGPVSATEIDIFERGAREAADSIAAELAVDCSMPVEVTVVCGTPSSVLLESSGDADLLVVGTRGRGGFAALVLGSTSSQCATHSLVPTVVVPTDAPVGRSSTILVGFDGSQNSLAALAWAIDFADPGTTIECVSVWDVTPIAVGTDQFFFPEASGLARDRFEYQVEEILATHGRDAVQVNPSFVAGQPRHVLAAMAGDVDLVVVGARRLGAIGSAVLGSVSTWLLHHVARPMVLVPTPADGVVAT